MKAGMSLRRKRLTRDEVDQLLELGIFGGQRYELIDGDLIDTMGQSPWHAYSICRFQEWLFSVFGAGAVRIQAPVEAAGQDAESSLPEPDLAVLAGENREYHLRHPRGNELLLAVEISDGFAAFDLGRKATLYAHAGVPEYWVLDLVWRRLVSCRRPDGAEYQHIRIHSEDETVSTEGRGETVTVSDLLPAPESSGPPASAPGNPPPPAF
jgi:Uma2 family endonuclease